VFVRQEVTIFIHSIKKHVPSIKSQRARLTLNEIDTNNFCVMEVWYSAKPFGNIFATRQIKK